MKSNKTSFKKGQKAKNWNGFRKGHSSWNKGTAKGFLMGGYRFFNIGGKTIPEHHLVWLKANQLHRLPEGCVIHHCNGIKNDNQIGNLQLMSKGFHDSLHWEVRKFHSTASVR